MENSENKYSFDQTILKALIERGPDFLTELFRLAMNEAMKLERENFLNAGAYERFKNRLDYANGFKPGRPTCGPDGSHSPFRRRGTAVSIHRPCGRGFVRSGR